MKPALLYLVYFYTGYVIVAQTIFQDNLANEALELTRQRVVYDPAYVKIDYPCGNT